MKAKTSTLVEAPWWYKHVPRDFMSSPDVTMMTAEEIGTYFLLLQSAWLGGADCTLPNDPDRLAKLARVPVVSDIVLSKFQTDENGRLYNPRLLGEWNEALKRSKDGKNNAKKRWQDGMPRHSGGNGTALARHSQPNATNTNTNTNKNKNQNHEKHSSSSQPASGEALPSAPSEPAGRVAQKLAAVLGRDNLKPATAQAWTAQAEGIVAEHGEQAALDVIQFALVDNSDGFWRGRIYAMKNFVRSFATMHSQMKRKTAGPRGAADPLAQRAASLQTGHDFSSMAKGDL
jgi:uncharacterized protein YdaU (DUF1376 family)